MMIANDVMIQSLLPNSPKLCFLISKKAYINAKSLEKSLTQHNKKKRYNLGRCYDHEQNYCQRDLTDRCILYRSQKIHILKLTKIIE
jgi:hypothetical protein